METQASYRRSATGYNPDVLDCLANLSNDEVFTPPRVANQMLDMLPQELFSNPSTTFLDPVSKSGVFLREIVKRLMVGIADLIPDRNERINHIFTHQVFGIAITNLTALISRRSLYCSKTANHPKFSYCSAFGDNPDGFIHFREIEHTFVDGKCRYCGASESVFGRKARGAELESHAYEFIHTDKPEKLFPKVKFDVIIGNPPYQLEDGGNSASAKPIYQLFVEQAKKLNPRYLTMIIPARWYTGGKGLDSFRSNMLADKHIRVLTDYINSKDCFSGLSVSGGICYFLWNRDNEGLCNFTSIRSGIVSTKERPLDEFNVLVRYNEAIDIIHKIKENAESSLGSILTSRNPYGLATNYRGQKDYFKGAYKLIHSQGEDYISANEILSNTDIADKYKVMLTRVMCEHAGEPGKDGMFNVLATIRILNPEEICTDTYITGGCFETYDEALNLSNYLKTKFVRFLILQAAASINLSKTTYQFVPLQDFTHPWTDEMLYEKYNLSTDEIAFIESMIRPMD